MAEDERLSDAEKLELPVKYKMEIDKKIERYERNRDRLLEALRASHLFYEEYLENLRNKLLQNFLDKEKDEKGKKYYKISSNLLIDLEYKHLQLKSKKQELTALNEKKDKLEIELRKTNRFEGKNGTILEKQKDDYEKLKEQFFGICEDIKRVEKKIKSLEKEIEGMEEECGKVEEFSENLMESSLDGDRNPIEEIIMLGKGEKILTDEEYKRMSLKKYREKKIGDLRRKNRLRWEVERLLDENDGEWIDPKLKGEIKEEMLRRYVDYYDKIMGSMDMESAVFLKNFLKSIEERYEEIEKMPEGKDRNNRLKFLKEIERAYGVEIRRERGKIGIEKETQPESSCEEGGSSKDLKRGGEKAILTEKMGVNGDNSQNNVNDFKETPWEIMERVDREWREKRWYLDGLLEILEGIVAIEGQSKTTMMHDVREEFCVNENNVKMGNKRYVEAKNLYLSIKSLEDALNTKNGELSKKNEENSVELESIKNEKLDMAMMVGRLRMGNTGWLEKKKLKRKLKKNWSRWGELKEKQWNINKAVFELMEEKVQLENELAKKKIGYGQGEIMEEVSKNGIGYKGTQVGGENEGLPLKSYEDKYNKMLKDKEGYIRELLQYIKNRDIGISEESKQGLVDMIRNGLIKELDNLKKGDKIMETAKKIKKWLDINEKSVVKRLEEIDKNIEGINEERVIINREIKSEKNIKDVIGLNDQLLKLIEKQKKLEREKASIKEELNENWRNYYGITYEDMKEEEERNKAGKERKEQALQILGGRREWWKEKMDLAPEVKSRIVDAMDKIPVRTRMEKDGSRLVEFTLKGKKYKRLECNFCGDDGYMSYNGCFDGDKQAIVYLGGISSDNVYEWRNKKLKEYVKKKIRKGFEIPRMEKVKEILGLLGEETGLTEESEQIGALMFLVGLEGEYWLNELEDLDSQWFYRCIMKCYTSSFSRFFMHSCGPGCPGQFFMLDG